MRRKFIAGLLGVVLSFSSITAFADTQAIEGTDTNDMSPKGSVEVEVTISPHYSVKIPKKISLSSETPSDDYYAIVSGGIAEGEFIYVSPRDLKTNLYSWGYTSRIDEDMRSVYIDVEQSKAGVKSADLKGSTQGSYNKNSPFVINNTMSLLNLKDADKVGTFTKNIDYYIYKSKLSTTETYASFGEPSASMTVQLHEGDTFEGSVQCYYDSEHTDSEQIDIFISYWGVLSCNGQGYVSFDEATHTATITLGDDYDSWNSIKIYNLAQEEVYFF